MSSYEGSYSSSGTVFITGSPDDVPEVGEVGEYDITRRNGNIDKGIKVRCFSVKQAKYKNGKSIKPSPNLLVAMCEKVVDGTAIRDSSKITWKGKIRRIALKKLNNQSGVELVGKSVPDVGDFEYVAVPSNVGGYVIKGVEVVHTMKSTNNPGSKVAFAKYMEAE